MANASIAETPAARVGRASLLVVAYAGVVAIDAETAAMTASVVHLRVRRTMVRSHRLRTAMASRFFVTQGPLPHRAEPRVKTTHFTRSSGCIMVLVASVRQEPGRRSGGI